MSRATVLFAFALLCISLRPAQASTFSVTINDSLQAKNGNLAFDFIGGSTMLNNGVSIAGFSTDGVLGSVSQSGSVSGSLTPGPLRLQADQFFNELLQSLTYGSRIDFTITTGDNTASSGAPDAFSFFLLDNTRNPYATSDSTGADALFTIELNGSQTTPNVFTSDYATATVTTGGAITPEPKSIGLVMVGVLLGGGIMTRFKRSTLSIANLPSPSPKSS